MKLTKNIHELNNTSYLEFELTPNEKMWFTAQDHQSQILNHFKFNLFSNDARPYLLTEKNNKLLIINRLDYSDYKRGFTTELCNKFLLKIIDELIDARLICMDEGIKILDDVKTLTNFNKTFKPNGIAP